MRINCNLSSVGSDTVHRFEVLQDIFGCQCASVALYALGNFCGGFECIDMVIEPIGRMCNSRQVICKFYPAAHNFGDESFEGLL